MPLRFYSVLGNRSPSLELWQIVVLSILRLMIISSYNGFRIISDPCGLTGGTIKGNIVVSNLDLRQNRHVPT